MDILLLVEESIDYENCDYYSTDYDDCKAMKEQCKTVEGKPCVFPFIFREKEVTHCISGSKRTQPWCPTQVDSNLAPIRNQWGYCDNMCPSEVSSAGRFFADINSFKQ